MTGLEGLREELARQYLIRENYQVVLGVNFSRQPTVEGDQYPLASLDEALAELNLLGQKAYHILERTNEHRTILDYTRPNPRALYEAPSNGKKRPCPHVIVVFDEQEEPLARAALWISSPRDEAGTIKGNSAVLHLEFGLDSRDEHDLTLPPTVERLCALMVLRRNIAYGGSRHYAVLYDKRKPVGENLTDQAALEHIVPGIHMPPVYD